jgi:AcrR family transcriptional regulator/DNA-binding MarR family transcriptional regulator
VARVTPAKAKRSGRSGHTTAKRRRLRPDEPEHGGRREAQRVRILFAIADVCRERGINRTTVTQIVSRAGVARRTFYQHFEDCDDCFLAAFDETVAHISVEVIEAYRSERSWVDGVRAGLWTMLLFFEENPELAWLCVVESLAAGPTMLARRAEVLESLTAIVDEGRVLNRPPPPPLAAEGAVGAVFALVHRQLLRAKPARLLDLVNPLMSIVVLPYLGGGPTRRELARRVAKPRVVERRVPPTRTLVAPPSMRLTDRTVGVLSVIAQTPGANNREVAKAAGVIDDGQISKLLTRLSGLGLVENNASAGNGLANAWTLMPRGEELLRLVRADTTFPGSG